MEIHISRTKRELGRAAAARGGEEIRRAIRENGRAHIVLATGASQFEMLDWLVRERDIDWGLVSAFHLDEYIGMPMAHPASFRRYLKTRFADRLPMPVSAMHYINAEARPDAECARLNRLISGVEIDVAFIGIGENGHLAFNDPPANFETEAPYLIVDLNEACRRQQVGEGWFAALEDVPLQAISASVRQIMRSRAIVCSVPDERKAEAVTNSVEGSITVDIPASILQRHPHCALYLDDASASRLTVGRR